MSARLLSYVRSGSRASEWSFPAPNATATVPAGTYSQLRFVITDAYIEVENGDGTTNIYASSPSYAGLPSGARVAGELQMPSLAQSGLKVDLPGGSIRIEGDQRILLVDFDVAQSFGHAAGGSGRWVMHPVVHATEFVATGTLTATLRPAQGVTLPAINNHQVTLGEFKAALLNAAGSREARAEAHPRDRAGRRHAHFGPVSGL